MRLFLASLFIVLLTHCDKRAPHDPTSVDAKKVRSIVVTDPQNRKACEVKIAALGATILYRNEMGLIFTDRENLAIPGCTAMVVPNHDLPMERSPAVGGGNKNTTDLPTLLRLLPAEEIGARSFIRQNPTFDGRGVTIAVLDTGLELDHPMLRKTTTGETKIIDLQDFSGEGRVALSPVTVADGSFTPASGIHYSVKSAGGTDFKFGVFRGSSLAYSEDVASKDIFKDVGVITYSDSEGKRLGRIDTDDDKNFDNEVELANYAQSQLFTKLGEKKTLSVALNIVNGGDTAVLAFDDGAHGTHVAGIAAGYEPDGLQGVAPGARVLGAKIGDNRLSGGSTTTASMLLAIDFAVSKKAQVINLSYGIRSGSNVGKSAIDKYVDKVAVEKGVLFSISAGNEGPGLLTIGTPAGAELAITNGAYISRQTARDNYGYVGMEDNTIWFFSSIGPRLDGGLKPTLLSPGSALSSVPLWDQGYQNYRGTSMASPQTTGGLALLLSAATQSDLPSDRASITRAVYGSAKKISGLSFIEQGNGLLNVPSALEWLKETKDTPPIEYYLAVNSATSPDGKGKGILVRSRNLPASPFTVTVTPVLPPQARGSLLLKTFKLEPSASWIHTVPNFWIHGGPRTFQVELDPNVLKNAGLFSEKISAIDEATGVVDFVVPVTVLSPLLLNDSNRHFVREEVTIRVGQTLRYFLDVPAGTTAMQVDLLSDGPIVWGQLLDPEGRQVGKMMDSEKTSPQPPLALDTNVTRPGVYEIDLVAPAYNQRPAKVRLEAKLFSLSTSTGPEQAEGIIDVMVQNNFESLKLIPILEYKSVEKTDSIEIQDNLTDVAFSWSETDQGRFSALSFLVTTSKNIYDLMTDYPYRVFCEDKALLASGGLELMSEIRLENICLGALKLEIQGAFTHSPPARWIVELTEKRRLKTPISISKGNRILIETGQNVPIPVNLSSITVPLVSGMKNCAVLTLETPAGRKIQEVPLCR